MDQEISRTYVDGSRLPTYVDGSDGPIVQYSTDGSDGSSVQYVDGLDGSIVQYSTDGLDWIGLDCSGWIDRQYNTDGSIPLQRT